MTSVAEKDPAAIRSTVGPRTQLGGHTGKRVFAATVDAERLASVAGTDVADGSVAVLVDGIASAPWMSVSAGDLAAGLVPLP